MKSVLLSIPFALAISVIVSRLCLQALGMDGSLDRLLVWALLGSFLLLGRNLVELGILAALTGYAQLNAQGTFGSLVPADWVLALLLSLICLPIMFRMMGMELDFGKR